MALTVGLTHPGSHWVAEREYMSSMHALKSSSVGQAVLPLMPETNESRWRRATRLRGS
eukprot:COSAG06_NODE_18744_length_871_cov_0.852332_2_plen_57_part_01